jgi:hypothetical protein
MKNLILLLTVCLVSFSAFAAEKIVILDKIKKDTIGKSFENLTMGYHTFLCGSPFGVTADVELQIKNDGVWQKATSLKIVDTGGSSTGGTNFFVDKNYSHYRAIVSNFSGEFLSCSIN